MRRLSAFVQACSPRSFRVDLAAALEPQNVPYVVYLDMMSSKDEIIQEKDAWVKKEEERIKKEEERMEEFIKMKDKVHALEMARLLHKLDVAKGRYNSRAVLETCIDATWRKCKPKSKGKATTAKG